MKPLKLSIEGLNSFSQKQEIDFEYLTQRGVFGIFGATGSGKSTILDAIILALYGKVPRLKNELVEAINLNKDFIDVYFEFSISNKKYSVRRVFNRTKNGISTKEAVVYDESKTALTEKATETNKKLEEIIGLNAEDFTRSVVLPQGKFSEFLKLNAKARRDMLERMFNLEEYGTGLNKKIKADLAKLETEHKILKEKIVLVEGMEEETYEELSKRLKEKKELFSETETKYIAMEKEYNEKKKEWEKYQELQNLKAKKESLENKREYYNELEEKLKKIKSALEIKDDYDYIQKLSKELEENEIDYKRLKSEFNELKLLIKETQVKKEKSEQLREERVPEIITRVGELKQIIELENERSKVLLSLKDIKSDLELFVEKEKEIEKKIFEKDLILKSLKKEIELLNKEISENEIDPEKRRELDKYYNLVVKNRENNNEINKIKDKMQERESSILSINKKIIKKTKDRDILKLRTEFSELAEKREEILALENMIGKIKEKIAEDLILIRKIEENILDYTVEIEGTKALIASEEDKNRALILAKNIKENEPCPVCGAKDHPEIVKGKIANISKLKESLAVKEKGLQEFLIKKETMLNEEKRVEKDFIEKEREYNELLNGYNKERYSKLLADKVELIEDIDNEKKSLIEKEKEISVLENQLENDIKLKKEIEESIKLKEAEVGETKKTIEEKYDSEEKLFFEYKAIGEKDKKRLSLKESLDKKLEEKESEVLKLEILKKDLHSNSFEKAKKEESYQNKENLREELDRKLEKYSCDIKCKEELEAIEKEKKEIELSYEEMKKIYEKSKSEYERISREYFSREEKIKNTEKFLYETRSKFNIKMKEAGFENSDNLKEYFYENEYYDNKKIKLKEYRESFMKLEGNIEKISKEIKGKDVSEEYEAVEVDFKTLKNYYEKLKEELSLLKDRLKRVEKDRDKLKVFYKQIKDLEAKIEQYNDLKELFKANKFVDYIAKKRLEYIAKEASKRLKDISRGRFALEISYNGSFVIRDDFNGGARRNTSTLSGGEQFLTSLSLALALSNHIQLRGNANLEFFFLDEGFGTLDSKLLDIVINSLENIQSHKLHIGLISHVEELKERIERKLIVKAPLEAYEGTVVELK